MAENRLLSTMRFETKLKCKLSRNSYRLKTVKDAIGKSPLYLSEILSLNKGKCQQFVDHLYSTCQPRNVTALDVLEKEEEGSIRFGNYQLDSLLHDGIKSGTVTEFVGPAGVGKTQWCLYYAMLSVLPKVLGGCNKDVIYIDLENTYRQERFIEILRSNFPRQDLDVTKYVSRIHVFQPLSIGEFSNLMNSIEEIAIENEVGLFIIDSIASLVRRQIAVTCMQEVFRRARLQATWMSNLKRLAQRLSICVILTNQVSTRKLSGRVLHNENYSENEDGESTQLSGVMRDGYQVIPALGYKWAFAINTRFILQYTSGEQREMIIAKSPVAPFAKFNYLVGKWGIKLAESGNTYSNCGVNPAYFKIRVQHKMKLHKANK